MSFNISSAKNIHTDNATYLIYAKPGTWKNTHNKFSTWQDIIYQCGQIRETTKRQREY